MLYDSCLINRPLCSCAYKFMSLTMNKRNMFLLTLRSTCSNLSTKSHLTPDTPRIFVTYEFLTSEIQALSEILFIVFRVV